MRYLGIDFGEKNVGLAISDPLLKMGLPLTVLRNSNDLVDEISTICKENNINIIVVGESKNYSGGENEIMKQIRPFVQKLEEKTGLEVKLHPEFLTSFQAEKIQGKTPMHDASAAAIILTSFLETHARTS